MTEVPVDERVEPGLHAVEERLLLRARDPVVRDPLVEPCLDGVEDRGLQAVDRLALCRRDLRERFPGAQLLEELARRQAEVVGSDAEDPPPDGVAAEVTEPPRRRNSLRLRCRARAVRGKRPAQLCQIGVKRGENVVKADTLDRG